MVCFCFKSKLTLHLGPFGRHQHLSGKISGCLATYVCQLLLPCLSANLELEHFQSVYQNFFDTLTAVCCCKNAYKSGETEPNTKAESV